MSKCKNIKSAPSIKGSSVHHQLYSSLVSLVAFVIRSANYIYISPLRESSAYASEVVGFKEESALFTRFKSCLLLGESGQDHLGNGKSG